MDVQAELARRFVIQYHLNRPAPKILHFLQRKVFPVTIMRIDIVIRQPHTQEFKYIDRLGSQDHMPTPIRLLHQHTKKPVRRGL